MNLPLAATERVWAVGSLCHAAADALDARFNPVAVRGEISGYSRAPSGHCYFTLKDAQGQLRCAMFRRAAGLLDFVPRDGELVEVRGRLGVYEPRGDLQLVVETLRRAGQGALFEQFLQLKARLEAQGWFAPERKRVLPALPRAIGVVTSLHAAALHDVITALRRRVPHIPVVVSPASVQGAGAPAELVDALTRLGGASQSGLAPIDVILLVRGGGSLEDLWAFNDERVAQAIVNAPVPVICGVGHETDFTIADFCADLRAPTPTAAAELVAQPRELWCRALDAIEAQLQDAVLRRVDRHGQRLDQLSRQLGRPSGMAARQRLAQNALGYRLRQAPLSRLQRLESDLASRTDHLAQAARMRLERAANRLERSALRLELLDPALTLQRGYAMLTDANGVPVTRAARVASGDALTAILVDGAVDVAVVQRRLN
jgi:exodeoxyribonuclease VII large subunit